MALARYRTGQGDPEAAIRLLSPIERENAGAFALQYALASAHLANDSPAFALDSARRALELQPQQPAALLIAARAEQANGRYAAAQDHIEEALSIGENVTVRKLLVENLLLQNKLDAAREQLQALPEAEREAPAVRLLLGRIAMAQERHGEAEALFRSLNEDQSDGVSLAYLAGAQWALGRQQEAISSLEAYLSDNPADAELRNQLATRYLMTGDDEAARSEYRRLMEDAPESPMVLNNLAWLERQRDPRQALDYVRRALELAPDSLQIIDTYAMVERARGNYAAALELSDRALAQAPESPELRLNRALILIDAGRAVEAEKMLEALVEGSASPQAEEARELLSTLVGSGPNGT